jgi:hypothetical protein
MVLLTYEREFLFFGESDKKKDNRLPDGGIYQVQALHDIIAKTLVNNKL